MIVTPETPGARWASVFDAETGERVRNCTAFCTHTNRALVLKTDEQGRIVWKERNWLARFFGDGVEAEVVEYPNPCILVFGAPARMTRFGIDRSAA